LRTAVPIILLLLALLLSTVFSIGSRFSAFALSPASVATDGPGALSHFDLSRKDCLGTARNTTSKVWFTIANGVLSDVYYPTVDNTNVETMQYIVTDGSTFTDLQTRDTTYTVKLLSNNSQALDCEVTTTAKSGKYSIITDYLTDTNQNTLVMKVQFIPLVGNLSNYKFYVRYDPSINGNGGGGSGNGGGDTGTIDTSTGHNVPIAFDTVTKSNAVNRTYAVPVYSALDASTSFTQVSNGFVGQPSDGLVQLDTSHHLTAIYSEADNGNLVQTSQANISRGGMFTLALGFGTSQAASVSAAEASLATNFSQLKKSYESGWNAYDSGLNTPPPNFKGVPGNQWHQLVAEYYLSANVVKASEDKTFPGAIVASLSSPWGQAISAGDPNNLFFGSYREVFARDLYEAWTGLLLDGDLATARDAVNFLFNDQQQADGSMPRNSLLNGMPAPDSSNTQLDECSYPIIMAYQLGMTDSKLYPNIKKAANFVISHGPSFGPERWEEQGGYSPSTISAEVAGLVAAADIAKANGDTQSQQVWLGVADDWQRSLEGWTVTSNGPKATHPYFIRLSKTGDPNAAISYNVGNGGPTLDQRSVIDAGFLELVRLGLKPFNDTAVTESLPIVDATIGTNMASGQGWHRYNGDGYGDGATDGHPWAPSGQGTGHLWPVLTEERGEYDVDSGQTSTAVTLLSTMQNFASGVGLIPEQDWELPNLAPSPYGTDPTVASIGFQNGQPAGSAAPLTWSAGVYVRLLVDLTKNSVLERPADTYNRYVTHQQGQTSLTVTAPSNQSAVNGPSVTVTGTSVAGNTIYVAATNTDNNSQTTVTSTPTNPDGSFSVTLPVTGGTTVLNTVAVSPTGATAHDQRSIVFDFTPGTVLLDVTDPTNDDNGPGNYAYPTAADFHPGAFDITEFKVILSPDGSTVTFKLQTRDLSPTFGSPLGAQLADVYVHDPNAATTSTDASFPQRNYSIDPASAWSRLLEVQGFGQRYIDAKGNTLGTIAISANAISRYITFSVPTSSLGGTPGKGWGFTVVLTGQDGFSADQARSFAATPQPYNFGVCATASSDPHCTVDPSTVPKAMDVLTPPGVLQSDELDYTKHNPVVIQGVFIP